MSSAADEAQGNLTGSCLCGRIRYEVNPSSITAQAAHCHCVDCRKHCGAAFSTYAETDKLVFVRGKDLLTTFVSPDNGAIRRFCSICGSSLTFRGAKQSTVEFSLASLDVDDATKACRLKPDAHVFYASKVPWVEMDDGLPKYTRDRGSKQAIGTPEMPHQPPLAEIVRKTGASRTVSPAASSSLEKCSFVCHLLVFPVVLVYLVWAVVPQQILQDSFGTDYNNMYEFFPPKAYALHLPVSAVFIFLAAPLIYAGLNAMTVVPKVNSMDTLQDVHTRRPKLPSTTAAAIANNDNNPTSTLPEICDLDPSMLVWQHRSSSRVAT